MGLWGEKEEKDKRREREGGCVKEREREGGCVGGYITGTTYVVEGSRSTRRRFPCFEVASLKESGEWECNYTTVPRPDLRTRLCVSVSLSVYTTTRVV
jgi:hypothetical protein